jgi:drug/metabolite transporter (DMT)-like permease
MMGLTNRQMGIAQIILSGVCFGFLGYFGKSAYAFGIKPGELLALRYFISAILTLFLILLTNRNSLFKLTRFEIISSLMLGIFGYALFSSFFFLALSGLSASLTVLLLYTYPVMVMILSHYLLKEYITKIGVLALIAVTIGMTMLVWGEWSVSNPTYLFFGVGAAFFYALYIIYSHRFLKNTPALPSSFYVQLGAGVVLSLIHFGSNPNRPINILSEHFVFIVSMAILCSLMAMSLFLAGLQKITSTEASILSTTEPISGVIIATVLLHEKISFFQLTGGLLILVGMILCARRSS